MGRTITIGCQKGGVGKTTVCQHLAYCLAAQGLRVLAVDLDPQINLTVSLTKPETRVPQYHIANLLTYLLNDQPLPPASTYIAKSGKIDFLAGSKNLSGLEPVLQTEMGAEQFLSDILAPLRTSYDYILIDTNRATSPLMVNALTAADSVLIPVCPEFYSTEGLSDFITTVLKNKRRLNPHIEFEGIVFSMCDLRTNQYRETRTAVETAFESQIPVFQTAIPRTVQVGEAISRGMTILEYAPSCKASLAYQSLAKEVTAHVKPRDQPKADQNNVPAHGRRRIAS